MKVRNPRGLRYAQAATRFSSRWESLGRHTARLIRRSVSAIGRLRPIAYLSTNLSSNCHGEVKSRTRALPRATAQAWTWRHYSAFPITLLRHNDKQLAC